MLTINLAQMQAWAMRDRVRFVTELDAMFGAALASSDAPLDLTGIAGFVDACCAAGIEQEDAIALLLECRVRGGAQLFDRGDVRSILTDPELTGRTKAYQINLRAGVAT